MNDSENPYSMLRFANIPWIHWGWGKDFTVTLVCPKYHIKSLNLIILVIFRRTVSKDTLNSESVEKKDKHEEVSNTNNVKNNTNPNFLKYLKNKVRHTV